MYFSWRFSGVLLEKSGRFVYTQVAETPPIGTLCEFVDGGLAMAPIKGTPSQYDCDMGRNGLRGRAHGTQMKSGGAFKFMGERKGEFWFRDEEGRVPNYWLKDTLPN